MLPPAERLRVRPSRALFFFSLFVISCGGGGNACLSCGGSNYTFPKDDPNRPDAVVQSEVSRARITQSFIDFIQPQLGPVLAAAIGGGAPTSVISVPIGDVNDIVDVSVAGFGLIGLDVRNAEGKLYADDLLPCPDANSPECTADPQNCQKQCLNLRFERPNGVRLSIDDMRLGLRLNLDTTLLGSDSSCPVFGDLEAQDVAAKFDINVLLEPGVGPDPDRNLDLGLTIDDIEIADLEIDVAGSGVYCSLPACQDCAVEVGNTCLDPGGRCNECFLVCGGVLNAITAVTNALIGLVRPVINALIQPVLNNFIQDALADINNTPAKIEAQVDLGETLGIDGFRFGNPFGIFIAPQVGKFPVVDRGSGDGMEVTVDGGAEAELANCVAGLPPFNMPKGDIPVLGGFDLRGRPYHLGFTLASSLINQMLYSVHRAGTLCLKIGSKEIRELTGGSFTLNASLLSLLASDLGALASDKAPIFLQMKPQNPPVFALGSGEVIGQDADGNDIVDPLLKFNIEDLGLAFYVLIQDRYTRIFEVTMSIDVGANIVVLPDNTLELAITQLDIGQFEETFNELLPNADFADVLPALIDVLFGALISSELKFDLDLSTAVSDALGGAPIFMRVNEIYRDGVQEDYLTMTMTFSSTTSTGALSLAAFTSADLHEEDLLHERDGRMMRPTGRTRLLLGQHLPFTDRADLEYQVRVDKGLWHTPRSAQPDDTLTFKDAKLKLPGQHMIEVRARYSDDYTTMDPTPVELFVTTDPVVPAISAQVRDEAVQITVHDNLSTGDTLALRGRFDDGAWFDVELTPTHENEAIAQIALASVGDASRLELIARDEIGNESAPAMVRVGLTAEENLEGSGCACHEIGAVHAHTEYGWAGLLLLLGLAMVLRVRVRSRTRR